MNIFNKIKINKPKSNKFDLSHEKKLSMNMAELTPIYLEEIVPGDRFKVSSEIFIRMAPMLAPIMHRVNVFTHFFFVPNRIVWDNWKEFITGGEDGLQAPVFPYIQMDETSKPVYFEKGSLADYFGLPVQSQQTVLGATKVNALPFRAYTEIYNEYYRDQNVTPKIEYDKGDGFADISKIGYLRKRAWEKDYFTSSLPWPQRGADVNLPVESQYTPTYLETATATISGAPTSVDSDSSGNLVVGGQETGIINLEQNQQIQSTAVTINELRVATRLQEWLERNARGGSRYIEQILSHFGVRSSDARLQRPEYLGGGKNPIVISEVLNQAGTNNPTGDPTDMQPVGDMSGHGYSMGKSNSFSKSFEEHGYIIGIMSVLPRTTYQQGIERTWSKFDKLDYYWPEFAHLGEQEVLQQEIYWNPQDQPAGLTTFGYQTRFAEYKYKQSMVSGDFRDTLSYWHMGRYFETPPALNTQFIEADPTTDIFAVEYENADKLWCQIYNKVSAIRPMPYFGTPYL